jgi:signal transduction histidine kinase
MINVEYNNNNNSSNGSSKVDLETIPPFMVEADKTRIMQVISNLLTNAIKFTRGGRVVIRLDHNNGNRRKTHGSNQQEKGEGVEAEREVTLSFIDSGTGIDPQIIDRIFEKFVTKSDKGTGLGLFISKKIIEAHGGNIWAKNNTNSEGATIAFSIPVASQHR